MGRLTTWIGLSGLLLLGCATVHPDFEKYFGEYQGLEYGTDSPSHGEWMRLVATRYGCDTMDIRTGVRSYANIGIGLPPCDIAGAIPPGVIRAYNTPTGTREEWRFGSGSNTYIVNFEGATTRTLKSTFVQWH